jgi:hypothetical protein
METVLLGIFVVSARQKRHPVAVGSLSKAQEIGYIVRKVTTAELNGAVPMEGQSSLPGLLLDIERE